ncbi:MAG: outer membrane protein multidrug efflux system [Bradyrhizobium sp.]|nr:outer membrane protein multidrug efflux system [Bradyrhizobium sp.]
MKAPLPALFFLVLAACAGPRPETPPAATVTPPQSWRTALGAEAGEVDALWWKSFGDPALAHIVDEALAGNDDIELAATRVVEARGQFHLAKAQALPNIVGAATAARDRDVNPGFGVPEQQIAGVAALFVSYDVDLFGRLANASQAAHATLLSSEAAHDNVRLAITASVVSGYINLRALDGRLVVLRDTLTERAASLEVARRRASAGYASQLDLAQAEADYRTAAQLIPAAELAITRQEDGLSVLLGTNPHAIERGLDLNDLVLPTAPVMMPAAMLRRRPDIVAAEDQLVAADRALDSARAAFMPDIQLSALGGFIGTSLIPSTNTNPVSIFSLGGSILAPIFDSGRLQAQQETAAARRDQAAFAYRKAAITAFREVEDALAGVRRLAEQEAALVAQRDVLARTLGLATNRYRAGYSPYLDQLDAERGLLSVELTLVQSRADRLDAAVSLYQALGGGWQTAEEKAIHD